MEVELAAFEADVPAIFQGDGDVDIAVAFVSEPGLELVRSALHEKLLSGGRVRILLDLREGATDPTALWDLVSTSRRVPRWSSGQDLRPGQGNSAQQGLHSRERR